MKTVNKSKFIVFIHNALLANFGQTRCDVVQTDPSPSAKLFQNTSDNNFTDGPFYIFTGNILTFRGWGIKGWGHGRRLMTPASLAAVQTDRQSDKVAVRIDFYREHSGGGRGCSVQLAAPPPSYPAGATYIPLFTR